jgi:hypothetical protein
MVRVMRLILNPIRLDHDLPVSRAGDALTIGGCVLGLAPLAAGEVLPRDAIDCPWVAGDVTRDGQRLVIPVLLPVAPGDDERAALTVRDMPSHGAPSLPPTSLPPLDTTPAPVAIDWSRVRTEADREADALAEREAAVNRERARRLEAGAVLAVPGVGRLAMQGREEDRINLIALAQAAQMHLAAGAPDAPMLFRDAANAVHLLTPAQMLAVYAAGTWWAQSVYLAAWSLKDRPGGPPPDFADDAHWPGDAP